MKISAEEALTDLIDTDQEIATCKEELERADWLAKRTEAAVFERLEGTVAERSATAKACDEVNAAKERYLAALLAYELLANKRKTRELVVGWHRTIEASRRAGA